MRVFLVPEEKNHLYMDVLPRELYEQNPVLLSASESNEAGDEKICAVLALGDRDNTLEILYIYVEEEYRRKGIGKAMISFIREISLAFPSDGIYASYVRKQSDELDLFFKNCGFSNNDRSKILSVPFMDIHDDGMLINMVEEPAKICPLEKVSARDYDILRKQILRDGDSADPDQKEVYIQIGGRSIYHPKISRVYYDKKSRPSGCVLCSERKQGVLVDYLYVRSSISVTVRMKIVLSMLYDVLRCAEDELELGRNIFINAANPEAERIFRMVVGNGTVRDYGTLMEWRL